VILLLYSRREKLSLLKEVIAESAESIEPVHFLLFNRRQEKWLYLLKLGKIFNYRQIKLV
jgi:hypothetical protein